MKLGSKPKTLLPPSKRMEMEKEAITKKLQELKKSMQKRKIGDGMSSKQTNKNKEGSSNFII